MSWLSKTTGVDVNIAKQALGEDRYEQLSEVEHGEYARVVEQAMAAGAKSLLDLLFPGGLGDEIDAKVVAGDPLTASEKLAAVKALGDDVLKVLDPEWIPGFDALVEEYLKVGQAVL